MLDDLSLSNCINGYVCVDLLLVYCAPCVYYFFFNHTATTEIYTLSLHDALPICPTATWRLSLRPEMISSALISSGIRSEEHTSELQSQSNLVCRLLLEKKKQDTFTILAQIDIIDVDNYLIHHMPVPLLMQVFHCD